MAKQESKLDQFAPTTTASRGPRPILPTKPRGETVGITVRFSRSDWDRLTEWAREKEVSMQALFEYGASRLLEEEGLPALQAVLAREGNGRHEQ